MSLQLAIEHALKNPIKARGRTSISRMGAVLVKGKNRIRYYGWNSYKTHPLAREFSGNDNQVCIHAELDALLDFFSCSLIDEHSSADLEDYTMYVARVLKDGTTALAKPCVACQKMLIHFGVGNVEWTI